MKSHRLRANKARRSERLLDRATRPEPRPTLGNLSRAIRCTLASADSAHNDTVHPTHLLRFRRDYAMQVPTAKKLIDDIRAGQLAVASIPVQPPSTLAPGITVTFKEATFDDFGIPAYVENGDTAKVTLTKARRTGDSYHGSPIYIVEWEALA